MALPKFDLTEALPKYQGDLDLFGDGKVSEGFAVDPVRSKAAKRRRRIQGRFAPELGGLKPQGARKAAGRKRGASTSLETLFTPQERGTHHRPKRQPTSDIEPLYEVSGRVLPRFDRMAGAVARALGGTHHTGQEHGDLLKDVGGKGSTPHTVVAPLKGRERADEKVTDKYEGDYGRLTDVVRGSVIVPTMDDVPDAMNEVRRVANIYGFDVVHPESRFTYEEGSLTYSGAKSSGYVDASMLLRDRRTKLLTEFQIHSHSMWYAKEIGPPEGGVAGHALYDKERAIVEKFGDQVPPDMLRLLRGLEQEQRQLYEAALAKDKRDR